MTDLWDNAGTAFNAIKINVTNTASAAASKLMDLQIGGTSMFSVSKAGKVAAAANYVLPNASGGGLELGNETTSAFGWRDILGPIVPREGGGAAPAFTAFRGGQVKDYAFSGSDIIDLVTYHIPHDYVPGTDIFFHPHWGHNGTAISGSFVLDYYVTYAKGHGQAIFPAEINLTQTLSTPDVATIPQWSHEVNDIQLSTSGGSGTQLDTDLLEPDGVIEMAVVTTTIPTITGSATSNLPYIFEIDVHYQSTNIATKNNTPNFYT